MTVLFGIDVYSFWDKLNLANRISSYGYASLSSSSIKTDTKPTTRQNDLSSVVPRPNALANKIDPHALCHR